MSAAPERDDLADVIAQHTWLPASHWSVSHRCTCGRKYDNPNASQFHTHARHVADMVRNHLGVTTPPPSDTYRAADGLTGGNEHGR